MTIHIMDERTYRAHPALSRSLLDKIKKSPAHLKWAKENEEPDTDYFRFGRLVHSAVLEPDKFWPSIIVWDGARRYGKTWDEFKVKHADKEILTASEESQILAISNAVMLHGVNLTGTAEGSIFWKDERTGLELKARLDLIGNTVVFDLKTTQDASAESFLRSALDYGYHRQAAWYLDAARAAGHPAEAFVFIAVEKAAPYGVATYVLDAALIDRGRLENEANLDLYKACKESGHWPGYPTQPTILRAL